jgi:hypothetical protein
MAMANSLQANANGQQLTSKWPIAYKQMANSLQANAHANAYGLQVMARRL